MKKRYHVSAGGAVVLCRATSKPCPKGEDRHYNATSVQDAIAQHEYVLQTGYRKFNTLKKSRESEENNSSEAVEIDSSPEFKKKWDSLTAEEKASIIDSTLDCYSTVQQDKKFIASYLRVKNDKEIEANTEYIYYLLSQDNRDNLQIEKKLNSLAQDMLLRKITHQDLLDRTRKHINPRLFETYEKRFEALNNIIEEQQKRNDALGNELLKAPVLSRRSIEKDPEKAIANFSNINSVYKHNEKYLAEEAKRLYSLDNRKNINWDEDKLDSKYRLECWEDYMGATSGNLRHVSDNRFLRQKIEKNQEKGSSLGLKVKEDLKSTVSSSEKNLLLLKKLLRLVRLKLLTQKSMSLALKRCHCQNPLQNGISIGKKKL